MYPYNFAPRGWAFCQGQILPIAQNTALFSLLGTTYGGNGQTTFGLPDLRGRVPNSSGQGPGLSNYDLGQVGGTESVTLITNQMPAHTHGTVAHTHTGPAHTHAVTALTDTVSDPSPTNNMLASGGRGGTNLYVPPTANTTTMASQMIQSGGALDTSATPAQIGITGGSQPFDILVPYLTLNYCIALEGIFPCQSPPGSAQ
ncbi:MAG: phage tail protein [Candidatus Entotheonellia bacterium]